MTSAPRPRLHTLAAVALTASLALGAAPAWALSFTEAPRLSPNPNPAAPLAGVLTYRTDTAAPARVTISGGGQSRTVRFDAGIDPAKGLPIVGLKPDTDYSVSLELEGRWGRKLAAPAPLSLRTPALDRPGMTMPALDVAKARAGAHEAGVVFISLRRRAPGRQSWQSPANQRFARNWGVILAVDKAGDVVWRYQADSRIAGVEALKNGNILYQTADLRTREIDLLGNVVNEWYAEKRAAGPVAGAAAVKGVQTVHHLPYATTWGTYFTMAANARRIDNYLTSVTDPDAPRKSQMVMGDSIIEFNAAGDVVWSWDAFDHLDVMRVHFHLDQPYWKVRGFPDHLDWTHGNGVTFDPKTRTVIASFKHQDALIGIDYDRKTIKWILGEPTGWSPKLRAKVLKPINQLRWPYSPHHPHVTPDGTIVYYDNGMFLARPFTGVEPTPFHKTFSRAVEVRIDEKAMTATELWTSERELTADSCNNWAMGEAHKTPAMGNVIAFRAFCPRLSPEFSDRDEGDLSRRFVDDAYYAGRVDEYAAQGDGGLAWRLALSDPNEMIQWQIYGGFFEPDLYWGPKAKVMR